MLAQCFTNGFQTDARLAVRSLSGTSMWTMHSSITNDASSSPQLAHVFDVNRTNVGDRHVVDIKFLAASRAILVNDSGAVYQSHFAGGHSVMYAFLGLPVSISIERHH